MQTNHEKGESTVGEERPAGKGVKKISISLSDDVLDWVCHNSEGLDRVERRIDTLEKALAEYRSLRSAGVGSLGPVAPATVRPAEIFGELTHIKNVSAKNARAVAKELVPFLQKKKIIYRDLVLRELFPKTRSTITNEINYWYNACKGVLDRLIERGYVTKIEKGKYQWIGAASALVE